MSITDLRHKISAFAISYNSEMTIRACLKSLSFADELILVDKCSSDSTIEKASGLCDRIVVTPFSPTVEETRQQALDMCQFDWIVFLDADEMFNAEAIKELKAIISADEPLICSLPRKDYVIGRHSSLAFYWPSWQIRCFHKSVLSFSGTVHDGFLTRGKVVYLPVETGSRIEHLSHADISTWIEKTNRYTSQRDRRLFSKGSERLGDLAHEAIERWSPTSKDLSGRSYESAVGLLMAVYEIVDALKEWEAQQVNSDTFADLSARFEAEHQAPLRHTRVTYLHPLKKRRRSTIFSQILSRLGVVSDQ